MSTILVIDDNADDCEMLRILLEQEGHQVRTAPNGREALVEVIKDVPEVVILDLRMPEMDGPSFLEVARSYLRFQTLPVIIYTGLDDGTLLDRARALKANSILAKGKASKDEIVKAVTDAVVPIA